MVVLVVTGVVVLVVIVHGDISDAGGVEEFEETLLDSVYTELRNTVEAIAPPIDKACLTLSYLV